jgi:hypothetical protein
LLKEEKKKRIDMLQQLAINNAKDYPNSKNDANMMFMCSLFIELTELGGSIPQQLQSIVSDSMKNGDLVSAIPKRKGRPEDWQTSYEICESLLTMIVDSKEELSLNKHIDKLAKVLNKESTTIYKIIKRHGNIFAFLYLDWSSGKKITEKVKNTVETVFMSKEDKEFQDNKDFATSNPS